MGTLRNAELSRMVRRHRAPVNFSVAKARRVGAGETANAPAATFHIHRRRVEWRGVGRGLNLIAARGRQVLPIQLF